MLLGRVDSAIEEYNYCLKMEPEDYSVEIDLANVYIHIKDYERAKNILEEVIEHHPTNPSAYYSIGRVYELMLVYQNSLDAYEVRLVFKTIEGHEA